MEGGPGPGDAASGASADAAPAMTKEEAAPVAVTRSASRIPLPTGEHGARSATHLVSLLAGPGPPAQPAPVLMTPGGLAALAEGGSSLASPATASPARRPSDLLLDQRDHAPLDIRDSGDCAQMGPPAVQGAPGLRAQGDAAGSTAAVPQQPVPSAPQAIPAQPPTPTPAPHALLVQAVCSRSRLAPVAVPSGDLSKTTAESRELPAAPPQPLGGRSTYFDVNASDVYLSTTTSLDQGLAPPEDAREAPPCALPPQQIPEVVVTDATPRSVTPPEEAAPPAPALADTILEPAGAPPPPPPTPAQSSAQTTPDRKTSPVAPAVNKKATKAAPAVKTASKTGGVVTKASATRRLPAATRLSTARLGGSTGSVGAVGAAGAKDDASVTLIKAPPRAATRPASARSVRSATTTGTVTTEATTGARGGAVPAKRAAQASAPARASPGAAAKSASATVNRKASVTTRDSVPVPRLELSAVRPKSTQGPHSARGKPSRELSSLSASGGGSGAPHPKVDVKASGAQLEARPELTPAPNKSVTVHRPHPRASKDALLASGAGEDIAVVKSIDASQEVWPTCMSRLDEELKCMTAPYLVLVAELASRHGVLLDVIKDKDPVTHAEEAQFAVTLAHRQAEALRVREKYIGRVTEWESRVI
ncbi:nascent polypeptide-associated complex subunit alpha, muscle-specific form-like isoform X2 [Frankliniella occidentalis]|uniref:Nascent polypeptide-associated complex subunit alpha, muscle-specific form-like isoform X2 n=1 Tax=Frankliniella occidentalis TaxID=133901 RepID=A0A9C6XWB8_FRAOC|nr:nascent polypeptide-associated complex subunit alpha, muscle-specific form-like isoform X2 [Frankliniella occidentalis]